MPTQRPAPLTTGTPGSSCSRSVRSSVSTSSTEAVTTSRSMMSATLATAGPYRAPGRVLPLARGPQGVDHVGGDHRVGTVNAGGAAAGLGVQRDAGAGRVEGRQALGQQRPD